MQYFESINKISTIQMDLTKMNVRMKFYDQYEKNWNWILNQIKNEKKRAVSQNTQTHSFPSFIYKNR